MGKKFRKKILLCVDPGKKNFAYAVLSTKGNLLDYCLIHSTFDDLIDGKSIISARNKLYQAFTNIKIKWSDHRIGLVYERFIPRGMHKGNLGEVVNMCIGGMLFSIPAEKSKMMICALSASTWKRFIKTRNMIIENSTLPIHVLDAVSMGFYWLLKHDFVTEKELSKQIKKINSQNFGWSFKKNVWIPPNKEHSLQ